MANDTTTSPANDSAEMSEMLTNMLGYLEQDKDNLSLLSDTAAMALDEGHAELADQLYQRYADLAELPKQETSQAGLAAMKAKNFKGAETHFQSLFDQGEQVPAIRFNLAWSLAMNKKFDAALEAMDEATLEELPQAAMLELQILHDKGDMEKAEEKARALTEKGIDHPGLNAAISVLALDVDDEELAKQAALKAGNHPDALTTLGTLALGEDDPDAALELFNTALDINKHGPRTFIGKGLAQMLKGDNDQALVNIDQGAEMFGTHIGSWIAAGWAHFVKEDMTGARERFERALSIDDNFAESHGSLAVLDVIEGNLSEARRRTKTAMKLDRECFSAALAQILMISSNGNTEKAQEIFERAINTPVDESGRTIARSMTRLGLSPTVH